MNLQFQPVFAIMGLGGGELVIILAVILLIIFIPLLIGGIILFIFLKRKKQESTPPPLPAQPWQGTATVRLKPSNCPQCGAMLPSDAPEGLCPACLLQRGLATEPGAAAPHQGFVPPEVSELAAKFPQLEIMALIGRGGMGAVYKARQKELDRIVALKILPPGFGADPAFAERFSREAKALAKLNHPGVVTIHDVGRADGLYYFVMEFVDGVTLRQLLGTGRIAPREALAIVPQICDALQYAHDQGIVHRDIKPENIMIDRRGRVKVADFGLAKLVGSESEPLAGIAAGPNLTSTGNIMGTPDYMAPEQMENPATVDHRADIYALGVVFYQMLTGQLPNSRLEPPSKKILIDVRLDEVVLRALEQNPGRRYQQASQIKTGLETIASSPAQPASGGEYKSAKTLLGHPLLHVTWGCDPKTNRAYVARGVVAVGGIAKGIFAFGGRAYGLFAFGGFAVGLFAFGGVALGGLALGGMAIGLILAAGGFPISLVTLGSSPWLGLFPIPAPAKMVFFFLMMMLAATIFVIVIVPLWAKKQPAPTPFPNVPPGPKPDRFWRRLAVVVLALISIPFLIALFGIFASIAIPNYVRARERSRQIQVENSALEQLRSAPVVSPSVQQMDSTNGDSITITTVQQYNDALLVKGHYKLISADAANLQIEPSLDNGAAVYLEADRELTITSGTNDFELLALHVSPGHPHISMDTTNGTRLANVSFNDIVIGP